MQQYTAVRATSEYVPLQATTAATSAQHHSMCHPHCAVKTAAQVGGEGFWTQELGWWYLRAPHAASPHAGICL